MRATPPAACCNARCSASSSPRLAEDSPMPQVSHPTHRLTRRQAVAGAFALLAPALASWAPAALAAEPLRYHDGEQWRDISLQPDLVADFSRGSARGAVARANPGAQALPGAGDSLVQIYRLPAVSTRQAVSAAARAEAQAHASPVYRQGRSPAGRLMALPGGVMVKFPADWTRERIDAFLAAQGLAVQRPLAIGPGWVLVGTAPGDAALQAAQRLHATGEVLAATPNWWMQTAAR